MSANETTLYYVLKVNKYTSEYKTLTEAHILYEAWKYFKLTMFVFEKLFD